MKKVFSSVFVVVFVLALTGLSLAADKAATTTEAKSVAPDSKTPPAMNPAGSMGAMRSNFIMLSGAISNIDATDPNKVKIELKSERDNQVHTVEVTPATNVTKATDVSELKVGETVRVMARKVDDKEVAMGVMFGKLKKLPAPPKMPTAPAMPDLKAPAVATKTKK